MSRKWAPRSEGASGATGYRKEGEHINMANLTKYHKRALAVVFAACVLVLASAYPALAQVAPSLGTADSFAVLGGPDGDQYRPERY